jgi:single-strand DNA-binding protein
MAEMDDGSYSQAAPKTQPRSNAPAAAQRPASSGFDDMDDDIPF